jgi:uncharacterized protein (TIGR03083 family)
MSAESLSASGRLDPQRYFESIDADTERLLAMADRGLDAPVPRCPGWTVADVVRHVGQVYEHKVRVMADNAWPTHWPPEEFEALDPVDFLVDAKAHLFAEFANHQLDDQTTTFSDADTTVAFWVRRMALEIAVHRLDGEGAQGDVTPIPDDVAVDGVDEVLTVMLGGPWWESRVKTEHPVDAVVGIETGSRRWLCNVSATRADIGQDLMIPAAVTISGDPEPVFLWLWGRADDDRVTVTGSREVAREFRQRLAECTG